MRELKKNELGGKIIAVRYKKSTDEMSAPIILHGITINNDGQEEVSFGYLGKDVWLGNWFEKLDPDVVYLAIDDIEVLDTILQVSYDAANNHINHIEDNVRNLEVYKINKNIEASR